MLAVKSPLRAERADWGGTYVAYKSAAALCESVDSTDAHQSRLSKGQRLTVIVPEHGLMLTVGQALVPHRNLASAIGNEDHVKVHSYRVGRT